MEETNQASGLKRFFKKMTHRCFKQLLIENLLVADYVSTLLTRFSRTSQLYRIRDAQGDRLEYIVDFLREANNSLDFKNERFSPFREREVRQHIGDYTLFMTGIFRESVEKNSSLQYYMDQGKFSYSSVSEFDRLAEKQGSKLFQNLSERFEDYSWALDYMRKVYFKDPALLGPYRAAVQGIGEW
jgi:hypothetical protein